MNNKLIFACLAGSHAYGLNRPDSDVDIRGVCIETIEQMLGLSKFEQYVPNTEEALQWSGDNLSVKAEDVQIYGISKFVQLLMDANPNIVELLFATPIYATPEWFRISNNSHLFLSNKIVHTFSGYAYSQLIRIKNHKRWIDNPPAKPDPFSYGMELTVKGGQRWTDSNQYNAYQSQLKDYQSYEKWLAERNPKRKTLEEQFGYDTKHAMHLYRLFLEAEELLITGHLTLPLKNEHIDLLKTVYEGKIRYSNIVAFAEGIHDSLKTFEKFSVLPDKPNHKKIEELLINLKLNYILEN